MSYRLTESAKYKYAMFLGVLTLSGILPMFIAGLWIHASGL